MIKNPLISIVVPVYNVEKYLDGCIQSILDQSYHNIEIVLINDGSTDTSSVICKKYNNIDNRVRYIETSNKGVSYARNVGIEKSTGEYIAFVDSDDITEKEYVSTLVAMTKISNMGLCNYSHSCKDSTNDNKKKDYKILNKDDFILLNSTGLLNVPYCKLFKRNIIEKYNIKFKEDLSLGEDLLFNLDYLSHIDKVAISSSKQYRYRNSGSGSLSKKYYKNAKSIQTLLIRRLEEFFKNTKYEKELNQILADRTMIILDNEFKKNDSFKNRYLSTIKLLKEKDIKEKIIKYKKGFKQPQYMLLKNNMYLNYKIINKLSRYLSKYKNTSTNE